METEPTSKTPVKKSRLKNKKKTRNKDKPKFDQELASQCERLIGARVASMQYPGGDSRESVKLILKKGQTRLCFNSIEKKKGGFRTKGIKGGD